MDAPTPAWEESARQLLGPDGRTLPAEVRQSLEKVLQADQEAKHPDRLRCMQGHGPASQGKAVYKACKVGGLAM